MMRSRLKRQAAAVMEPYDPNFERKSNPNSIENIQPTLLGCQMECCGLGGKFRQQNIKSTLHFQNDRLLYAARGEMAEWFKAAVLKTVVGL